MPLPSDEDGNNTIVDQVLHDADDYPERGDDDEDGYVKEAGELNLNDPEPMDDRRREERNHDNDNDTKDDSSDSKKDIAVCCSQCQNKKNKNGNGRGCICQVPSKLRRGSLGNLIIYVNAASLLCLGKEGCFTCNCSGCHPDDVKAKASRKDDRYESSKSHGDRHDNRERHNSRRDHAGGPEDKPLRNGCCRGCMKAFSETKRVSSSFHKMKLIFHAGLLVSSSLLCA